jgi:uncharacterized membrane protein
VQFRKNAISPFDCLREGWLLVRGRLGFFVLLVAVGLLVGSLAPLGILLGPMACGIYIALFAAMRGEEAGLGVLVRGFDYFLPSLVATLIQIVPIMGMAIPVNLLLALLFVKRVLEAMGQPFDVIAAMLDPQTITLVVAVSTVVLFVFSVLFGTFFMFSYPLIVERRMSGWAAVKASAAASRESLAGAAGLMALTTALSVAGFLLCYVGGLVATPVALAAWAVAYRRVFPEADRVVKRQVRG